MKNRNFAGEIICLEIICAAILDFLSELSNRNIPLEQVISIDELTLQLSVRRKYLPAVEELAIKRGAQCNVIGKKGINRFLKGIFKRPVLIGAAVLIVALTIFLPTRILFYKVVGNSFVPMRKIIAIAGENGMEFGVLRRDIRSEKVKNALLNEIPELEWVGINTSGCVATISVKERRVKNEPESNTGVSNIVAICDGLVQEITITSGSSTVLPGQPVKEGQVLISGYTDCGLCVRACRAKGEVYATTKRSLSIVLTENGVSYGTLALSVEKISLIFGKNRINFFESSGILDTECVKMYEENYVTLPGGFVIPIGFVIARVYTTIPTEEQTLPESILTAAAERYLNTQMISGRITGREEVLSHENGVWYLKGIYECLEMIGREQSEEIIKP